MKRMMVVLGGIGLGLSLLVHFLTYLNINLLAKIPPLWLLHMGIFGLFVPMLFSIRLADPQRRFTWRTFFAPMPFVAKLLVAVTLGYVLLNFVLFMGLTEGGGPSVAADGRYVIENHGTVIREITADEYAQQLTYVTRGFSGHWLLFYLVPTLYFFYQPEKETT